MAARRGHRPYTDILFFLYSLPIHPILTSYSSFSDFLFFLYWHSFLLFTDILISSSLTFQTAPYWHGRPPWPPALYSLPIVPILTYYCSYTHLLLFLYSLTNVPILTYYCSYTHLLMFLYSLTTVPILTYYCSYTHLLLFLYSLTAVPILTY